MKELWYRLTKIPDLTLNKYASLDGSGVDGVIEKHIAFLRQINRKGIVSGLSYHLFYLYIAPKDTEKETFGQRLQIYLLIRGEENAMENVSALIKSSSLAPFFELESKIDKLPDDKNACSISNVFEINGMELPKFNTCAFLSKTETFLPAGNGEGEDYYFLRDWEMNEDGRLYSMYKMMEALNHTALYRVDLFPVERSISLRESLRKPMSILRKRQDAKSLGSGKDYDGKDVLDNYEDLLEKFDTSPHFIANVMVFANCKEDAVAILDAAGSESLIKGKYNISTFSSDFHSLSFLDNEFSKLQNLRESMIVKKGRIGLVVCREDTENINLNYLPTLFSLEEVAPFFRFPTLYDGETIQIAKETAPASVNKEGSLYLGKDKNNYDVYFPLSLLPKHAFVSGVPGSGKTKTMLHITSSLWKEHGIPFLVLEPAKQEYRSLANDPDMKDVYLFSPNADMSFPIHINPFEMPKKTLVAEHIRRLCSVFEGAFPLEPPMPFLLDTAIEAVYRELGWIPEHVYTGDEMTEDGKQKRPLPTMSMLYRRLEQELKSTQYSDEVRGNLESALKVRIGSLLRREMGDVFDVPRSTFTPEKWLEVPAVIELESMGTGPANFLTLMLCSLIRETLKVDPRRENNSIFAVADNGLFSIKINKENCFDSGEVYKFNADSLFNIKKGETFSVNSESKKSTLEFDSEMSLKLICEKREVIGYYSIDKEKQSVTIFWGNKNIRHIIFIEEAHNLIGPESEEQSGADADPKQAATAFIVKMLAEVRALKEGIVIADQLPTVMAQEVLKNTGLKLGLRITSADDRSLLGSTMAASSLQLEQMSTFEPGDALIFYEKLMRPFTMKIKEWWGEIKDQKEKDDLVEPKNDADLRNLLKNSETYIDENSKSVEIILDKYKLKLKEFENKFIEYKKAILGITQALARLNKHYNLLCNVALGKAELKEGNLEEKYSEFNFAMNALINWFNGSKDILLPSVETSKTLYDWVLAINRLQNGRWKRFGLDSTLSAHAMAVQCEIQAKVNLLVSYYNGLAKEIKNFGKIGQEDLRYPLLQSIKKSYFLMAIKEILDISQKIEHDLEEKLAKNNN